MGLRHKRVQISWKKLRPANNVDDLYWGRVDEYSKAMGYHVKWDDGDESDEYAQTLMRSIECIEERPTA